MNLKSIVNLTLFLIFLSNTINAQKHEFVEGKKYDALFYELKGEAIGKSMPSEVYFKGGKMYATLMEEKIMYPAYNYEVKTDSSYTEDDEEIVYLKVEVLYEEDGQTIKAEFNMFGSEIEGTFSLMKGSLLKKKFEFEGRQKSK